MKSLIVGKCRETLSAADVAFILEATGNDANASVGLQALLCDEAERDHVLDDPALMHALLNQPGYLDISTQLFFYLVVRHSLRESSIDDRDVADYVASMLTAFASADRMLRPLPHKDFATEWSVDLLSAIADAREEDAFLLRTHLANYTLFMTGLFPERIAHRRERRAAPSVDYYESMGQMSFKDASQCRLAAEFELRRVFEILAEWFRNVRVALNNMSRQILFLAEGRGFSPLGDLA
ncbi:MAG: hypothetical protein ACI9X0_003057 [Kiritimatiellia bacterium]|jgi:hypothetical protein